MGYKVKTTTEESYKDIMFKLNDLGFEIEIPDDKNENEEDKKEETNED